jgi:hypothetical protein
MRVVKIFTFFVIGMATVKCIGQTNFVPGYYVENGGDTVRGFVAFRSERSNTDRCVFKADRAANEQAFLPTAIAGYALEDKVIYRSYKLKDEDGTKTTFMKVVIGGKVSLLQYRGELFAAGVDGDAFDLRKDKKIMVDRKQKADVSGLSALKVLMRDCEAILGIAIDKAFSAAADDQLKVIIRQYNNCAGNGSIEPGRISINPHVDFGVQASVMASHLSMTFKDLSYGFDTKLVVGGGVSASVFIPKAGDNFRLVLEANYARFRDYGYISDNSSNNDIKIDYSVIRLPVIFRFDVSRFFVEAGIHNQLIISQKIEWRIENTQGSTITTSDGKVPAFKSFDPGFLAGIGIKYRVSNAFMSSLIRVFINSDKNHPWKPARQTLEFVTALRF